MASQITSAEVYMVAERAVGQAANDLRAEFGLMVDEVRGLITGVRGEFQGELDSLRQSVTEAFKENNKLLRADITNIGESIQTDLVKQIEKYNTGIGTEVGKMIVETNKELNKSVENKLKKKKQNFKPVIPNDTEVTVITTLSRDGMVISAKAKPEQLKQLAEVKIDTAGFMRLIKNSIQTL